MSAWRREAGMVLLVAALMVLGTAVVYPGIFLRGEIAGPSDVLCNLRPWEAYAPEGWNGNPYHIMLDIYAFFSQTYHNVREGFQRGEWPLWNPYQMAGMPVLANYQASVFYPPRMLLLALDLPVAMTVFVLLKIWLCGLTAYLGGRGLALSRRGSLFLAVAWGFAEYNLIWANWPLTDVAAWFPILILGVEWALQGRYRRGIAAGAFAGAMMLLAGHPETVFTFGVGTGLYFAVRLLFQALRRGPVVRPVLVCGGLWVIAAGVCAAQLFPFAEYLLNSATFYARHDMEHMVSYPLRSLVAVFVPRFLGAEYLKNYWGLVNANLDTMLHPGAAVLLLSGWAFARAARRPSAGADGDAAPDLWPVRLLALFFSGFICMGLAFCIPSLDWVHRLPVFGATLRGYYVAFPLFALALAAAHGLDRWTAERRRFTDLLVPLAVTAAGFSVVAGVYAFFRTVLVMQGVSGHVVLHIAVSLGLFLAVAAALSLQCFRPMPRTVAALVTLLTAANLIYGQWGLNPTSRREDFFPRTNLTDHLRAKGQPCRIGVNEGGLPSGIMNVYNIQDWLGYDGLYPGRVWKVQRGLKVDIWEAFEPAASIQYYLNDSRYPPIMPKDALARLELEAEVDGVQVMRNPRALPHARLVPRAEVVPDPDAAIKRMKAPPFNPAEVVFLEAAPADGVPPAVEGAPGAVKVLDYGCQRVRLEADARAASMLVLADAWYPGWKATVNGTPAEILPAYHCFRAVKVPAGTSEIVFEYKPWTLPAGLAVSAASLLGIGAFAALSLLRARRRASAGG